MGKSDGDDVWLVGVKSIAAALQVGERTVERWLVEDETGLPVAKVGGRWSATKADLRQWKRQQG